MPIQVNSCTVIDDNLNIVNANDITVGVVTITGSNGNIETPGTITASKITTPPGITFFSPTNGSTGVVRNVDIVFVFDQPVIKGTGTIEIRSGSPTGTLQESFSVTSGTVVLTNSTTVTINPSGNYALGQDIYLVIPSGAFKATGAGGPNHEGLNVTGGQTYSFQVNSSITPGDAMEGGYLMCKSGGRYWIVAPCAAEVVRSWYCRNDMVTRAQQVSGCTGWFVPDTNSLFNPGYVCRESWDCYSLSSYWSNCSCYPNWGCAVNFSNGCISAIGQTSYLRGRAFRCVTY